MPQKLTDAGIPDNTLAARYKIIEKAIEEKRLLKVVKIKDLLYGYNPKEKFSSGFPDPISGGGQASLLEEKILQYDSNVKNTLYQLAYHGTPHNFDNFSLDGIGTGEGQRLTAEGFILPKTKK